MESGISIIDRYAAAHPTAIFTAGDIARWAIREGLSSEEPPPLGARIERALRAAKFTDPDGRRVRRFASISAKEAAAL